MEFISILSSSTEPKMFGLRSTIVDPCVNIHKLLIRGIKIEDFKKSGNYSVSIEDGNGSLIYKTEFTISDSRILETILIPLNIKINGHTGVYARLSFSEGHTTCMSKLQFIIG